MRIRSCDMPRSQISSTMSIKHFGAELPTYKGDMGPYWEDGIGSDAYYAAEDSQNQSDALSSEIVSTVAHV